MEWTPLQIPKDWVLLTVIVLVVTVDLLIILIGTAIPSSRLNATSVRDAQHPTATDVSEIHLRELQLLYTFSLFCMNAVECRVLAPYSHETYLVTSKGSLTSACQNLIMTVHVLLMK